MINKTFAACAVSLTFFSAAQAQTANPVRFVVGAGITSGGDKMATARYTNGDSSKIKAGSGLQLLAGVDYRVNPQVSLQANVGVHTHFTPEASNGDANFTRIPVELLAYFHPSAQWRIGGGARLVASPKLNGSGAGSYMDRDFKNATGAVLEAEYFLSPRVGLKVRVVNEQYKAKVGKDDFSGNHVGFFGNFYF